MENLNYDILSMKISLQHKNEEVECFNAYLLKNVNEFYFTSYINEAYHFSVENDHKEAISTVNLITNDLKEFIKHLPISCEFCNNDQNNLWFSQKNINNLTLKIKKFILCNDVVDIEFNILNFTHENKKIKQLKLSSKIDIDIEEK